MVTQGGRFIVVEIPGKTRRDLLETVERTAQLRFRLVACIGPQRLPCTAGTTDTTDAPDVTGDGDGVVIPPTAESSPDRRRRPRPTTPTDEPSPSGTANRAGVSYEDETPSADAERAQRDPSADPSADASDHPERRRRPTSVEPTPPRPRAERTSTTS